MEIAFGSRLKHAWNAFLGNETFGFRYPLGPSSSYRPDRPIFSRGNERSIITSVYNRIALDASSIAIQHARLDEDGRFTEVIDSSLNSCLSLEANLDQTGRAFIQDVVMSMLDEGCVAIVPTDTDIDPENGSYKIEKLRVGKVLEWYPQHVKLRVYNEQRGEKQDIILPKSTVALVENPFFAIMNEPNSTMQRLIRKLNILDAIDEQSGSGKLNLIIQLPYVIKTEARRQQAEKRRRDIEEQLSGSKYGVAYTDGTEHVVQLNRPIEAKETGFVRDFTNLFLLEHSVQTPELWLRTEEEYRLCSALKRAVWGDTINEPDNGLAFEFRGFTVSFAEGKIFVSDEGRTFARYEISHFLQDPGAVVRGIRRECLRRDSMRELSKI